MEHLAGQMTGPFRFARATLKLSNNARDDASDCSATVCRNRPVRGGLGGGDQRCPRRARQLAGGLRLLSGSEVIALRSYEMEVAP